MKPTKKLKSAHNRRKDWETDMPRVKYRIKVEEAIEAAGNANRLAKHLKITRAAIYQWLPPYREDPYMPEKQAMKFMRKAFLRERLEQIREV